MWLFTRRPRLPASHFEELQLPVARLWRTHFTNIRWCDLTPLVLAAVERSGVSEGFVTIQTMHTTTMIRRLLGFGGPFSRLAINESERGLVRHDLPLLLRALFAGVKLVVMLMHGQRWRHDREKRLRALVNEPRNAESHVLSFLFGRVSETLIVHRGVARIGKWQRVLFFDFDPLGREQQGILHRTVEIQVAGVR